MKVSCIFVCLKIVSSQLKRNENEKIAKKYVHIQNKNISYKYGKGRRKKQNDHGWSSQWTMCFAKVFYIWLCRSKWSLYYLKL